MEITEVRIKLMETGEDRLRGFCSVTFDDAFVVRDLKIIEGNNGPFVAMPSRKLTSNCHKCRTKNHLRSNYCNNCGSKLRSDQVSHDSGGRAKLYADIAHPVNAECREMIQSRVIDELEQELDRARQPGYYSRYDDGYDPLARVSRPHAVESAASRPIDTASDRPADRSDAVADHAPAADKAAHEAAERDGSQGAANASQPAAPTTQPAAPTAQPIAPTAQPADAAVETRTDAGHSPADRSQHTGSNPDNPNISPGRSKPAVEEFGKGIFD